MRLFLIDMEYYEKYVESMIDIRLVNNIVSISNIHYWRGENSKQEE